MKRPIKIIICFVIAAVIVYVSFLIVHAGAVPNIEKASAEYLSDELPRWASATVNDIDRTSLKKSENYGGDGSLYINGEDICLFDYGTSYLYMTSNGEARYDAGGNITECKSEIKTDDYENAYKLIRYKNGSITVLMTYKDGVSSYYSPEGELIAVKTECTGMPLWLCKMSNCPKTEFYDGNFKRITQNRFSELVKE